MIISTRKIVLFALMTLACGEAPTEPSSSSSPSASVAAPGRGFDMVVDNRLPLGGRVTLEREAGVTRQVGVAGVFATNLATGSRHYVSGIERDITVTTFTKSGDEHNAMVRNFFEGQGLPRDQIRWVTALGGGAARIDPDNRREIVSRHYVSSIERVIGGVPVAESHVWAKMSDDGTIHSAAAFWPSIDQAVVDLAKEFTEELSDPAARAAFLTKIGREGATGSVLIHHTPESAVESVRAFVSFDIKNEHRTDHYLRDGTKVEGPGIESGRTMAENAAPNRGMTKAQRKAQLGLGQPETDVVTGEPGATVAP